MRGILFTNAIVSAFICYLLLQLFFGMHGAYALRQAREYLDDMERHVAALQDIQARIQDDVVALQTSEERVRQEAHRIGYYEPGAMIILRDNEVTASDNDFGRYLPPIETRSDDRTLFRWVSCCVGLVCLILFALWDGRASAKNTQSTRDD